MVKINIPSLILSILLILTANASAAGTDFIKQLNLHGFAEFAFGARLRSGSTKHDAYNLLEQRVQLKSNYYPDRGLLADLNAEFNFKADFTVDEYFAGKTDFDLREANLYFSPSSRVDIKAGRQIFTWGTGDYLFINDLFPKDYISFYIGRDDEYLKKPSDGIKASFYSKIANLDLIAIPFFEPSTIFKGDRLSFFDTFREEIAGRESDRQLTEPARQFNNSEIATRLHRYIGSYEAAFYTFRGFYKLPLGYLNEAGRELFYPRLDVYGASLRGPALGGIANAEFGYYNSRQDRNGNNRVIENSKTKLLFGYEKDLGNDLRVNLQYLYEQILNYANYQAALLPGDLRWDEYRHLTTLRVSKLLKNQTVRINFFGFFSPSDRDGYIRPNIDYDLTDDWKLTLGMNLAWGEDDYTEFGQTKRNKNVFLRARYSF